MNSELPTSRCSDHVDGAPILEAGSALAKKDQLLERLNKRNKDRLNYLDVKIEQRQKEQLHVEGLDYFAQAFTERVCAIEKQLQQICSEQEAKTATTAANTTEVARLFGEITLQIQELQRYLTSSTMFLTEFKIKSCQLTLSELSVSCEEARLRFLPKKKFGFSGKKVAPKIAINPKVQCSDKVDVATEKREGNFAIDSQKKAFSWTLAHRSDEHICLKAEEVAGQDITISNVRNCLVELQGHAGSVQISNAADCIFLCGPIARSFFAEQLQSCQLAVACQQLRLHSSYACRIYLHVTCRAIIEDCRQIEISAYNYDYPTIEEDYQLAGLDKSQNNYADVADFNWLSPDVPSPNWQLLKDSPQPNWHELRASFKEKSTQNVTL